MRMVFKYRENHLLHILKCHQNAMWCVTIWRMRMVLKSCENSSPRMDSYKAAEQIGRFYNGAVKKPFIIFLKHLC